MLAQCVVNLDDILTIPLARLLSVQTELSPERMTSVGRAIVFALDLDSA